MDAIPLSNSALQALPFPVFVVDDDVRILAANDAGARMVGSGGIVPVCMHCKRVRQDGKWRKMEDYLHESIDLKMSHGVCVVCLEQFYPDVHVNGASHKP